MREDRGINGDAQRIEQLGWMLFLKIFDDKDQELELLDDVINPEEQFRKLFGQLCKTNLRFRTNLRKERRLNYRKVWQNRGELPVGLIVGCVEIFKIISTTPTPLLTKEVSLIFRVTFTTPINASPLT